MAEERSYGPTGGWTAKHAREVRARRRELAAILIRRRQDGDRRCDVSGIEWAAPGCTKLQAIEAGHNLLSERDFRESCALAGFDADAEVALVLDRVEADRCEICDWPLAETVAEGCVPGNCSYRPEEGSDEYRRIRERREAVRAGAGPRVPTPRVDRETLGQLVRRVWVAWALMQPGPKASWLVPWDGLAEPDREVDRRVGEAVARHVLGVGGVV